MTDSSISLVTDILLVLCKPAGANHGFVVQLLSLAEGGGFSRVDGLRIEPAGLGRGLLRFLRRLNGANMGAEDNERAARVYLSIRFMHPSLNEFSAQ